MITFSKSEKEQIIESLKQKIEPGFVLNDSVDVELDGKYYQCCSIVNNKFRILYLLVPDDGSPRDKEGDVGRLCKKYNYDFGYSVKCTRNGKEVKVNSISGEIAKLK